MSINEKSFIINLVSAIPYHHFPILLIESFIDFRAYIWSRRNHFSIIGADFLISLGLMTFFLHFRSVLIYVSHLDRLTIST